MSISEVTTYIDAAVTAITAQDWTAAKHALMKAEAKMVLIPNVEGRKDKAEFRDTIDRLMGRIKEEEAAAAGGSNGFKRLNYGYERRDGGSLY